MRGILMPVVASALLGGCVAASQSADQRPLSALMITANRYVAVAKKNMRPTHGSPATTAETLPSR